MAEIPAVQPFSGDSWDECITFIHKLRNVAWKEGKIQDQAWMANLASIHFLGEALAWYVRLPRDVQEDWSKLQVALANRWSASDAATSEDAVALPALRRDGKSDHPALGVLSAVVDGSDTTFYVQRAQGDGDFTLTEDVGRAIRFRYVPQSTSTLLEFSNDQWSSWLAIHWRQSNPNIGQGSVDFGEFSTVDINMKSSGRNSGPFQLAMFRASFVGQAAPIWRKDKTDPGTYMTVLTNGTNLFLSPDPEAYRKKYTSEKRASLYIQKIEE